MAETEYEDVAASLKGVSLRVVKGSQLSVPDELFLKLFYESARQYCRAKRQVEDLNKQLGELKEKIIKFVEAIDGLRGISSSADDFVLLAVKKEETSWDRDLLKSSLGTAYSGLVDEEFVANIMIPHGVLTEGELREGLSDLLMRLGVPAEDVGKLLSIGIELLVDNERLEQKISTGEIKLLEGAKETTPDWALKISRLKTPLKQKTATSKPAKKSKKDAA